MAKAHSKQNRQNRTLLHRGIRAAKWQAEPPTRDKFNGKMA
ncbi:hypothetical protein [Xenorhabdus anantnagensis]|uniref:Uncharacterized protein n=1 Tax=Xenorhabdus anantnagensis TaxID=3025875 RepID=A0ABT5LUK6_9GAMM|nr:hypothetical protein [Xenorhabdus anantnagensis]